MDKNPEEDQLANGSSNEGGGAGEESMDRQEESEQDQPEMDQSQEQSINSEVMPEEGNDSQQTSDDLNGGFIPPLKSAFGGMDYVTTMKQDCNNRFEYLLKQTEIFSHFMTYGRDQPPKPKVGRKPKPKEQVDVNDHRHRKTEEEEDAELLSESKKDVNLFR